MNKQLIIVLIAVVAVIGIGTGGWFYYLQSPQNEEQTVSQPSSQTTQEVPTSTQVESEKKPTAPSPIKSPLEVIKKIIPPRVPTLEEVAKKHNNAFITKSVDVIWEDIHPDSKTRWQDKAEYSVTFSRLNSGPVISIRIKEIKSVPLWTHPITGKVYSDLKEVINILTAPGAEPVEQPSYYQKIGDRWYFISQLLSRMDRTEIKATAQPGVSYKELSKSPEKYRGQKVKYSGRIIQIQEEQNGTGFIRLSVTKGEYDYDYNDIIYISYTEPTAALQDDIVTVYGVLMGAVSYASQAGYLITIPGMEAAVIEK